MSNASRTLLLLLLLSVSGCSIAGKLCKASIGFEILDEKPGDATETSREVLIISDTQSHNMLGKPVWFYRWHVIDSLCETAIRPAQLDFYSLATLEWLVGGFTNTIESPFKSSPVQYRPVIYLGDACDYSCTGEFRRFKDVMGNAKSGWVMAPGNHDGYFFGNLYHKSEEKTDWSLWTDACNEGESKPIACSEDGNGNPLRKQDMVEYYLDALASQRGEEFKEFAAYLKDHPISDNADSDGNWSTEREIGRSFLRRIAWHINRKNPWVSFVLQEVDLSETLSPVKAIILDTTQYAHRPNLLPLPWWINPAIKGEFLDRQADIAEEWLRKDETPGQIWLIFGHHPFNKLTTEAQQRFRRLTRAIPPGPAPSRVYRYVSGDTHAGSNIPHCDGDDKFWELNVGSTTDSPSEWRTLQFIKAKGEVTLWTSKSSMQKEQNKFQCQKGEVVPEGLNGKAECCEPTFYTHCKLNEIFSENKAEMHYKNELLETYHNLIRCNPTVEDNSTKGSSFWPRICSGDPDGPICKGDAQVLNGISDVYWYGTTLNDKNEVLKELSCFDKKRPVQDQKRLDKYRLYQAYLGSK